MGNKHSSKSSRSRLNNPEDEEDVFYLENWQIIDNSKELQKPNSNNKIKISNNILINKVKANPLSEYTVIKELGEGFFSKVFLIKHNITGAIRAMKKIKKSVNYNKRKSNEAEVINEVGILIKMDHPNIVKLFEFYQNENYYFLIMEYCCGGELFYKITEKNKIFEIQAAYIMYQILSAVNYCHKMKIIHRDIKPENVLIKKDEDGFFRVKICDFGTSQIFHIGEIQTKFVGSAFYLAPEVIKKKYNSKCDLWSCGVIMYELLTKKIPFYGQTNDQIFLRILSGEYNKKNLSGCSSYAKDLLSKLLEKDIKKRINAENALSHIWFKTYQCKELLNDIADKDQIKKYINNLKNYHYGSLIQETALSFLVHNYPDLDEIVNACKLFSKIDIKGNGRINKKELFNGLVEIINNPQLEEDTNKIFDNLDVNGTNYIDYEQFVKAAIDKSIFLTEEALKLSFNFFDKDEKGEITFENLSKLFSENKKNGLDIDKELKKIINEMNEGEERKISYELYCEIMKNILK